MERSERIALGVLVVVIAGFAAFILAMHGEAASPGGYEGDTTRRYAGPMRTVTLIAACAAALAGGTTAQASPMLRVVDTTPFVVVGSGFQAAEGVSVTAMTTLGPQIVRVRATRSGTFRARFQISTRP